MLDLHMPQVEHVPMLSDQVRLAIQREVRRIGITQEHLGERLGEVQSWVSRRINGITVLTVDDVERFARALELPVSALIEELDDSATSGSRAA